MLTRRSTLAGITFAGISPVAAAAASGLDLTTPAGKLRAYAQIRSRADGKPSFTVYRGTIYAVPDGQPGVPIFDVEGCSWHRTERIDDTHYKASLVEAGYYLDRATGQPLDIWRNPINGLDCKVQHYRTFQYSTLRPDAIERAAAPAPGMQFRGVVPPANQIGDQVWMQEDLFVRIPNKGVETFADPLEYSGPFVTATSLATWTAKVTDLTSGAGFVPSTMHFQTANSWRPFMRMGTTPGIFSWRMMGVKRPTRDGVPAALQARILKDYPDFFDRL